MQLPPGAPILKKKKVVPEVHPCSVWTLTPAQSRRRKPQLVDAKLFVSPYVVMKQKMRIAPIGPFGLEKDVQKRLEEAALLARWRRKHQPISGGSRSAGRPRAAYKNKKGKSRMASQ